MPYPQWRTCGWQEVVRGLLGHMQSISPRDGTFANLLMRTRDPKTGEQYSRCHRERRCCYDLSIFVLHV